MARRPRRSYDRRRPKREHRVNRDIRFPEIRVIDPDGNQLGIMSPDVGREQAAGFGLDLVEVAPNARPPVCRIMDYGKFLYDQQKKKAANKQSTTSLKTIRLRPKTDDHDLEVKLRRARRFLDGGDMVRFEMRMRGRERAKVGRWVTQLQELLDDFDHGAEIIAKPKPEGRTITATLQPAAEA